MDKMREAFEAFVRKEARHMDEEEKGYAWLAWKAATAQCVPDGFVVVPKEPTKDMVAAGAARLVGDDGDIMVARGKAIDCYTEMLEAAPKPGEQA